MIYMDILVENMSYLVKGGSVLNEIPKELFVTRSVHKNIGMDPSNSILSCGFIHHTRNLSQNENLVFKY